MYTKQHFLWLLLCSLCFVACRQDLEDEALIEAPRVEHSELRSMQALFESRYKTESLRSFEAKGELDFSELKVNWEHPVRDTLEGHIETTALTINLKDFRLPTSQTFDRADVERFRGLVSVPRLYHYKDLRSGKEYFAVVIIQPTKDWLEAHGIEEVYRSVRVPAAFEGQLDVYSVDKKPLLRYLYQAGRGVSHYVFSKQDKARGFRVECQWVSAGVSYQQSGRIEGGDYVIILTKVDQWEYQCRDVPDEEWWKRINNGVEGIPSPIGPIVHFIPEDSVGGVSMYDQSPKPTKEEWQKQVAEKEQKLREKAMADCDSVKSMLKGETDKDVYAKIKDIRDYYDKDANAALFEKGYTELYDGQFVPMVSTEDGTLRAEIPEGTRAKGYIHSHRKMMYKDDSVKVSVQIFSPEDLYAFNAIVRDGLDVSEYQAEDFYTVVVTNGYVYRLGVVGSKEETKEKIAALKGFYTEEFIDEFNREVSGGSDKAEEYFYSPAIVHRNFVDFLAKKYPLDGLVIQRFKVGTKKNKVQTTVLSAVKNPFNNTVEVKKFKSDC